ncbi:hypothetical protein [Eubacterium aggregans]|uniref:hypothetical protein n=1 Tax=Eubacterium aggregans TaxID=81409 RepID=UPI003F2D1A10
MGYDNNGLLSELTGISVQTADVEKIQFTRSTAILRVQEDGQPLIALNYGNGIVDGEFPLDQAPPDDCLTVRRSILDVLGQIDLENMCMNLEASAALIDVAYNACNGIGGTHENIYQLRSDVFNAVGDSVVLSMNFRKATSKIMSLLTNAYATLSSADNCDGGMLCRYLANIPKAAKGLAEQADLMSKRFIELEHQTLDEGKMVVVIEGSNIKEQKALKKMLSDYKAQLDAFNVSKKELEKQISEAQTLYTKYDNKARELNKKADTTEILGIVFGGIGEIASGVSNAMAGYYSAKTPKININSPQSTSTPDRTHSTETPAADKEDPPDVVARKIRLGSDQAELGMIEQRLPEYQKKLSAL